MPCEILDLDEGGSAILLMSTTIYQSKLYHIPEDLNFEHKHSSV